MATATATLDNSSLLNDFRDLAGTVFGQSRRFVLGALTAVSMTTPAAAFFEFRALPFDLPEALNAAFVGSSEAPGSCSGAFTFNDADDILMFTLPAGATDVFTCQFAGNIGAAGIKASTVTLADIRFLDQNGDVRPQDANGYYVPEQTSSTRLMADAEGVPLSIDIELSEPCPDGSCSPTGSVPEPGTIALLGAAVAAFRFAKGPTKATTHRREPS